MDETVNNSPGDLFLLDVLLCIGCHQKPQGKYGPEQWCCSASAQEIGVQFIVIAKRKKNGNRASGAFYRSLTRRRMQLDRFSRADKFIFAMGQIDRCEARVKALLYKTRFGESMDEVRPLVDARPSAARAFRW